MGRIAVCVLYVFCSILYLSPIAEGTMPWYAFNIITQIGFVGYLCYLQSKVKRLSVFERLFFEYLWKLSVIDCVYIVICAVKEKYWVWHNTGVFAYILGVSFVILLIHVAIIQHNDSQQ